MTSISKIGYPHPDDFEAEMSVLGTILKEPDCFYDVAEIIRRPEYFQLQKHRTIYRALIKMATGNTPIDIISLSTSMAPEKLNSIGGRTYLSELCEHATTTSHAIHHCRIVEEAYQRYKISSEFAVIAESAKKPDKDLPDLIASAEKTLLDLSPDTGRDIVQISDVIAGHTDALIKQPEKSRKDLFIETRVAGLNRIITGFYRQDLVIVAGPPSFGKTSFAIDTCLYNNFHSNKKILFFSIDQSANSFYTRLLTSATGIPKTKLISGKLTPKEEDLVCRAAAEMAAKPNLFLTDRAGLTALDIMSYARRVKRQYGLDMIVIDYIQQIAPHRKFETRNLELAEISRILKQIAKELNVVVLALSQLSRSYDMHLVNVNKEIWGFPHLTDLRDSGALEQDANMVLFPWIIYEVLKKKYGEQSSEFRDIIAKKPQYETLAYILVAKNKDGETGTVECQWDKVRMRFCTPANREEISNV